MADEERSESQGFYEMLWDCQFCETKALLAKTQRFCANCGGKQDPDKRYFPPEGSEKKVEGHKFEGSDRYCPSCNAPQAAISKNCTNCGAPQEGAKEVKGVEVPKPAPPPQKKSRWWLWLIGVGLVIVGIVFLVKWCNRTEAKQVTVASHRWERSIGIEKLQPIEAGNWDDQLPPNTAITRCEARQKTTKQIPDGETCHDEKKDKKDGTFEVVKKCTPKTKSVSVDGKWCFYQSQQWTEVDRVKTTGTGTNAQWPAERLPPETYQNALGAVRRGGKQQKYYLDFTGLGDKGQTCEVDETVWKKYADKQAVQVQVQARNNEIACDKL
jgi:hypothetical protein